MASITWFLFSSRLRIFLTALVLLVGLYALAGFAIVPWIARPRIVDTIKELTGRETRLDTLKLNPFTLSGTMVGFEVTDLDGEKLLSFDRAYANVQSLPFVFKGEANLKEVDVTNPFFRFQISEDGSINIADLINQVTALMAEEAEGEEPKEPLAVNVGLLRVTDGTISLTDLSRTAPFVSVIAPISFDITGFHTAGASDAPYAFSATSESGESFSWEGYAALNPVRSKGSFKVEGFSMPKYEPFYDILLSTNVVSGTIAVSASYEFRSGDGGIAQLQNASVNVENMEVVDGSDGSTVVSMKSASVTGATVDYLTMELQIESIELKDGSLHAQRLEDGQISLLALLNSSEFAQESVDPDSPAPEGIEEIPTPSFLIKSFNLDGFTVEVEDLAAPSPSAFALDNVSFQANDISSDPGAQLSFTFGADSRAGGRIGADGLIGYQPIGGSINLDIADLALAPGDPYLGDFADVHLADGRIAVSGTAKFDLSGEKPAGDFAGEVTVSDIQIIGAERGEGLVAVGQVNLEGIKTVLEPMSVEIAAITLVDPSADLIVSEDGSINLLRALRMETEETIEVTEPVAEAEPSEEAEEAPVDPEPTGFTLPFPVTIGQINLENVSAMLTDHSVSPTVSVGLETLSGTISGLSSEELARADLDLIGTLTGGTKLAITGKINPLIEDRYSDIEMTFQDFNLTTISPYSAKFAGYELAKGKLSFDLTYSISQAELEGENKVSIDQLTLGDKVESEDAMNLPIPLAVSLLKDGDGMIELDVPVRGNLNDPKFSYTGVILGAVGNIIVKIATSPFKMLGGLVGGGSDVDISYVAFAPGSTDLDEDATTKLELMVKAMTKRPTLKLEIHGAAGGPAESTLIRTEELDHNLQAIRWRELKDLGGVSIPLEEVELTTSDRDRLIKRSFKLMFPNQADAASALPESDTDAPLEPTPEVKTDADIAKAPPTEEGKKEPGGIGGFFKRLFSGGSKETSETGTAEVPGETAPVVDVAQPVSEQPAESAEIPGLSVAQMEARLLETIDVPQEELARLADARAETVRAHLQTSGEINSDRLFVVTPEEEGSVDPTAGQAQVTFSLE